MRSRILFVVLVLVLVGGFAVVNWSAFTVPTPLNLVAARVEAPLGLVMLALVAALTVLYALLVLAIEATALRESRRYGRELLTQRKLAEEAEASRYTALRGYLEGELQALRSLPAESAREVVSRLERLEETLKGEVERAGNTLAAYIGELEDRLSRGT